MVVANATEIVIGVPSGTRAEVKIFRRSFRRSWIVAGSSGAAQAEPDMNAGVSAVTSCSIGGNSMDISQINLTTIS